MCTLIIGHGVLGPDNVLLGANRDESPSRASLPPGVLNQSPRVVGGRDQVAGGTWLALREGPAAVALLNRYDPAAASEAPAGLRSRGLLALDVARSGDPLETALSLASAAAYAPFTLVFATPARCWTIVLDRPFEPRAVEVSPGWHVLTHRELDDPNEPRAAYLLGRLRDQRPGSPETAEKRLMDLLSEHGGPTPAVCLHQGRMVTVSSSILSLTPAGARYLHAEGRPCEHAYQDHSALLSTSPRA